MSTTIKSKEVVIVGGGVAGMAAAKVLNAHHIPTHLVEKKNTFGGHAANWACMATDHCNHCSACLSQEMAEQLHEMAHVSLYPESRVTGIESQDNRYLTTIGGQQQTQVDASDVILATGFTPAVPPGLMGDRWAESDRIITTEELNEHLRYQTLDTVLPDSETPLKIGFVQCVGSRNRELGKDYCSQVCCQISMRHINKLLQLYSQLEASLYYIDLQIIGKQARSFFKTVTDRVDLIQGVPFEVFDDRVPDKISVISEDAQTGRRVLSHFDLLVLSVGLHQNRENSRLAEMAGVIPDTFGFLSGRSKKTDTRIWPAGTIEGPMDIQKAIHHGIITANKVIETQIKESEHPVTVAIIGDSDEALHLAEKLQAQGMDPLVFGFDDNSVSEKPFKYYKNVELHRVTGTAGRFDILFKADNKNCRQSAHAVVVSPELRKIDMTAAPGMSDQRIYSLDKFHELSNRKKLAQPSTIVFWLDYGGPQDKASARKVLIDAIQLAGQGKKITILMANVLVNGLEGQKTYTTARQMGIRFLRVDTPRDVKIESNADGLYLILKEKTFGNLELAVPCDCLVIPEKAVPFERISRIAKALGIPLDKEGLLQSANIRHQWVKGPQNGIFYLGGCRGECDAVDIEIQMDLITSYIKNSIQDTGAKGDIHIDQIACKKCLTCYRTCPHDAIIMDDQVPFIVPESCCNCGLCIASCPALAIRSTRYSDEKVLASLVPEEKVVVFACERSGALAANGMDLGDGIQILPVPCVCRIGENILLKAIEKGKKVVLAGCHDQNCRSVKGSSKAKGRVDWLSRLPGGIKENIVWFPVAANESKKLERFLTENAAKQTVR